MFGREAAELLRRSHAAVFDAIETPAASPLPRPDQSLGSEIVRRLEHIHEQVRIAVANNTTALTLAVEQIAHWMDDKAIVRVLGAGRARLAAAIPANRLAHGGARVYMQDSIVPMPHSLHGGGIIAASASGQTPSVLSALTQARRKNREIRVVGIAAADATSFKQNCDVFIALPGTSGRDGLSALADIEEYAISELLDAIVVAAGRSLGYTDATWRLGHEDLGPATGPYDHLGEAL
ncbi:hypothetical protein QRX60_25755 [Amycolatopsis mongoliensis]|uniref:SIS domain-containing protein n=1 Tax=Amycolatopsis mongoliensis TaxID=715475 RepID=A0A9Y2K1C1_9PSEU|nr:hypothetical protein [Amycolatopsis sp. 4-36]WIY07092.1 hypothetical protein QRX60_25755 [Amycolatopsis sp. 4-36]